MSDKSAIEWTSASWNPTTGCTKVSAGCDNCYAEALVRRWQNIPGGYFATGFGLTLRPNMLERPRQWKTGRFVFVNSMSDLFHRDVPDGYLDQVFARMEAVDRHTYQVLTKRPERMRRYVRARYRAEPVPAHIWLGASVEDNRVSWRADMLREVNVPVRFLSVEPMIGPIDGVDLTGMSWVIVGGESGPRHRSMDPDWVRDVRDRCTTAGIQFFFKQWHKKGTGRLLDGRTWDQMPLSGAAGKASPMSEAYPR
jgi:protein gp37